VTILYEFEYSTFLKPLCCLGSCVPRLVQIIMEGALKKTWCSQMEDRGYESLADISATRLQAACRAYSMRRAERAIVARERMLGGGSTKKLRFTKMRASRPDGEPSEMDKLAKQLRDKEKQKEAKLVQQAERRLAEKRKEMGIPQPRRASLVPPVATRKDVPPRTDFQVRGPAPQMGGSLKDVLGDGPKKLKVEDYLGQKEKKKATKEDHLKSKEFQARLRRMSALNVDVEKDMAKRMADMFQKRAERGQSSRR